MNRTIKGWLVFAGIFSMICIWRLWYGIFVVFAYALGETALRKKRSFCRGACPIGNVLDFAGGDTKAKPRKKTALAKAAGWGFFTVYIAALLYVLFSFRDSDSARWFYFFRMMTGSVVLAIAADMFFGKRFWCIYMCPISKAMKGVLALVRR